MKIGIFGGSFDPVHNGHVKAAVETVSRLSLNRLIVIPAYLPPHKTGGRLMKNPHHRLIMLKKAFRLYGRIRICDYELKREGVSFTIDTVKWLRKKAGLKNEYFLLMGSDWAGKLDTWRSSHELLTLVKPVIFSRSSEPPCSTDPGTISLDIPFVDISSTAVREKVRLNEDISTLVPGSVRKYIYKHSLYFS